MYRNLLRTGFLAGPSQSAGINPPKTILRSLKFQIRSLSDQTRRKIDKAVASKPVVLFMKGTPSMPQCGFSRAVVQLFDLHDVPASKMTSFNCLEDEELRQGIKEYSDWATIPQIYIEGEFMGGCDMMIEMHRSGELSKVLSSKKIINPK